MILVVPLVPRRCVCVLVGLPWVLGVTDVLVSSFSVSVLGEDSFSGSDCESV